MLKLPTGRKRKWFTGLTIVMVLALVGGVAAWRIVEWYEANERAQLAIELAGEGVPPALAKHLADTLPEALVEGHEGPTSAADEQHRIALLRRTAPHPVRRHRRGQRVR